MPDIFDQIHREREAAPKADIFDQIEIERRQAAEGRMLFGESRALPERPGMFEGAARVTEPMVALPGALPVQAEPERVEPDIFERGREVFDTAHEFWRGRPEESALTRMAKAPVRLGVGVADFLLNRVPSAFLEPPKTPEEAMAAAVGGAAPGGGPVNLAAQRLLVEPQVQMAERARELAEQGRGVEAAGYSGAAALPVIGPMFAGIGEEIGAGDVAGGLTEAAMLAFAPRVGGRAARAYRAGGVPEAAAALVPKQLRLMELDRAYQQAVARGDSIGALTAQIEASALRAKPPEPFLSRAGAPALPPGPETEAPAYFSGMAGADAFRTRRLRKPRPPAPMAPQPERTTTPREAVGLPTVPRAEAQADGGGLFGPEAARETQISPGAPVAPAKAKQIIQVRLADLEPHPEDMQMRRGPGKLGTNEAQVAALKEKIAAEGFTSPVEVVRHPESGKLVPLNHHRLVAAEELGLESIPVEVVDIPYQKAIERAMVSNTKQGPLTDIDLGGLFAREKRVGLSIEEIAKRHGGRKQSQVEDLMALENLPEELRKNVVEGTFDTRRAVILGKAIEQYKLAPETSIELFDSLIKGKDYGAMQFKTMVDQLAPMVAEQQSMFGGAFHIGRSVVSVLEELQKQGKTVKGERNALAGYVKVIKNRERAAEAVTGAERAAVASAEKRVRSLEKEILRLQGKLNEEVGRAFGRPGLKEEVTGERAVTVELEEKAGVGEEPLDIFAPSKREEKHYRRPKVRELEQAGQARLLEPPVRAFELEGEQAPITRRAEEPPQAPSLFRTAEELEPTLARIEYPAGEKVSKPPIEGAVELPTTSRAFERIYEDELDVARTQGRAKLRGGKAEEYDPEAVALGNTVARILDGFKDLDDAKLWLRETPGTRYDPMGYEVTSGAVEDAIRWAETHPERSPLPARTETPKGATTALFPGELRPPSPEAEAAYAAAARKMRKAGQEPIENPELFAERLAQEKKRQRKPAGTLYANPITALAEAMTEKILEPVAEFIGKLIRAALPEKVKEYTITRYGQPKEYVAAAKGRKTAIHIGFEEAEKLGGRLSEKLTQDEQKALGRFLKGAASEADLAAVRNDARWNDAVEATKLARRTLDDLGFQAVTQGLLKDETFFKNYGKYMPRLYRKHEVNFEGLLRKYGEKHPTRLDLQRFKQRQDIPNHVRALMGEIEEPAYPVAKGIAQLTHDVETQKLFRFVADHPEWAADSLDSLFTAGKDPKLYVQMAETRKLGLLSGKYVQKYIAADLNEIIRSRDGWDRIAGNIMTEWKFGKTVAGPGTHARNMMSNTLLAHLGGLPVGRVDVYYKALRALVDKAQPWKEAREAGLFTGTYNAAELQTLLDSWNRGRGGTLAERFAEMSDQLKEGRYLSAVGVGPESALGRKAAALYQAEEAWFKMAKFLHNREKGMSVVEAVEDANHWLFDYSEVPKFVAWARRSPVGSPFITFTWKALPVVAESMITAPWRIGLVLAAIYGMGEVAEKNLGLSERDVAELERVKPERLKGKALLTPKFMLLPWKDKYGQLQYLDLTYILPWGDLGETQVASLKEAPVVGQIPQALIPGITAPAKTLYEIAVNKSGYTDKEIYRKTDDRLEVAKKVGTYFWRQAAPTLAPGGYGFERLRRSVTKEEDYFGRTTSIPGAVSSTILGLKLTPFEPRREAFMRSKEVEDRLNDLEREAYSIQNNRGLSPAEKSRRMARIRQKANAIIAKHRQVAPATEELEEPSVSRR